MKKKYRINIIQIVPKKFEKNRELEISKRWKWYCWVSISNRNFINEERSKIFFEWISNKFEEFLIYIDDYFHKYNIMSFSWCSEDVALLESIRQWETTRWFIKNIIKDLSWKCKFRIILSSEVALNKSQKDFNIWDMYNSFVKNSNFFSSFYQSNEDFRQSIYKSWEEYVSRKINRWDDIKVPEKDLYDYCAQYILTELALFPSFVSNWFSIEVYPWNEIPIVEEIIEWKYIWIPKALFEDRINISVEIKKIKNLIS